MISLEMVLVILDALRSETLEGLASPGNPTEFGFGTLHGQLKMIEELRGRLNDAVEGSEADPLRSDEYKF